jgi:hypothetical protein
MDENAVVSPKKRGGRNSKMSNQGDSPREKGMKFDPSAHYLKQHPSQVSISASNALSQAQPKTVKEWTNKTKIKDHSGEKNNNNQ